MPPAGQINNCCESLKDKEKFRTGKWEIKPIQTKYPKALGYNQSLAL